MRSIAVMVGAAGCSGAPTPAPAVSGGWQVGDVLPALVLPDQHGDGVALRSFADRVQVLALSASWCLPCVDLAHAADDLAGEHGDAMVHVTVLLEDAGGLRTSSDDAADWADHVDATGPVLADPDRRTARALAGGFPTVLVVGRDLIVAAITDAADPAALADLVEAELSR